MTQVEKYGNRRVSKMYHQWNKLRDAIRTGASREEVESALDDCEEWIDFAFGKNADDRS